jgi:hypothetical protein
MSLLIGLAFAQVDPACEGQTQFYEDEALQADHLLNYFALAVSNSPVHKPVPHDPGHGAVGVKFMVIPPLSCERRLVLNSTKTEDTNKAPMAPMPTLSFAFPELGPVVLYGSVGYVPPVTLFGTRNVIMSGEFGVGLPMDNGAEFAVRYHHTLMKTVAEIATPFTEGDPEELDFYSGSTLGVDLMGGYTLGPVTPYAAVGFTDASTFFYIGDDGVVGNNTTPFAGMTASVGVAGVVKERIDLAGEFYAAPGYLYTGRLRASVLF